MASKRPRSWKEVPTHPGYFVNRRGHMLGPSGKILQQSATPNGYLYVIPSPPGRPRKLLVHRAVLLAFVGPPEEGQEVRHRNGNRTYNRLCNLVWGSRLENTQDRRDHGTFLQGSKVHCAKLSEAQVLSLRARVGTKSMRAFAREFGVSHTTVLRAINGERWAHVKQVANG